jgi:CrcB protein
VAYLWIGLGSAIGGMARYWSFGMMARMAGETFPYGTLTVNIVGSLVIGFIMAVTGDQGRLLVSPAVRQFVMPGLCGGFTTFSTFSLETLLLARDGQWSRAGVNIAASVALCLAGVWAGHTAGGFLNQR